MNRLQEVERFLDQELSIRELPDYPQALNGLQLSNNGEVTKVAAAVDASLPVMRKAIDEGADLLIVHHGLFWQGAQRLVHAQYDKFAEAIRSNLAVYSAHIPLDVHPELGNNALLAEAVGMSSAESYHDWKGVKLGLRQQVDLDFDALLSRVNAAVGREAHFCKGRKSDSVGTVGVITGGAGAEVAAMAEQGIDTFITGEGPHWSHPLAEELRVNLIYAGHYATETFGVKALAGLIAEKWGLESVFVDHPTGI